MEPKADVQGACGLCITYTDQRFQHFDDKFVEPYVNGFNKQLNQLYLCLAWCFQGLDLRWQVASGALETHGTHRCMCRVREML